MSGRKMSREMAVGLILARQGKRDVAALGHDALEALVVGQAQQDAREVRIVLDDEQHGIVRLQCSSRSSAICSG